MVVFFSQEFAALSIRNTCNMTSRKLSQKTDRYFIQTSKPVWDFVMANICQVWFLLVVFLILGVLCFFFFKHWYSILLAEATSSEKEDDVFMGMVCPSGTNPDDSPLYVLCCNDTCSFTWTGAEHINQVRRLFFFSSK